MKINQKRTMQLLAVLFLIVILVLIGWNFITHFKRKPKPPLEKEIISSQKIEKKEKIEHFEVKGEKGNFKVRADKHYIGEDKKYHLEGNVEVIFFKKSEGQDIYLYAQQIIYDKKGNHFFLSGEATIKFKDLIIKSSSLSYSSKKETFRSEKKTQFTSPVFSGSALKLLYLMNKEKLELGEKVELVVKPRIENSQPFLIKSKRFDYSRKTKKGTIEGDVQIFQGKSKATAKQALFELSDDEQQIKNVILRGKVRSSLISEGEQVVAGKNFLIPSSAKREVEGEQIVIQGFIDLPKIKAVDAQGSCLFKFISSENEYTLIQGENLSFIFNRRGELTAFKAQKKAKITEKKKDSKELRIIEGEMMSMSEDSNTLEVRGKEKFKPSIVFSQNKIYGDEMEMVLDNGNLTLKRDVKTAFRLKSGKEKAFGFFSKEKPVFISAQEMRYLEEEKRFLFKEKVRMWQEKKTLIADEVSLMEEEGEISALGNVKTIIPYQPQKGGEEEMEIGGETLNYERDQGFLSYGGKCYLKVKNNSLSARSIIVNLKKGEGAMESVKAKGEVVVIQNESQGQGNEAQYNLVRETIILTGNPVLIDKNKGRIEGDKLTFYMADGRIVVENKERERSVTIIRS